MTPYDAVMNRTKWQVRRRIAIGLTQLIYDDLTWEEAIARCQSLNDEAREHIPSYFIRRQRRKS